MKTEDELREQFHLMRALIKDIQDNFYKYRAERDFEGYNFEVIRRRTKVKPGSSVTTYLPGWECACRNCGAVSQFKAEDLLKDNVKCKECSDGI